MSRFLSRNGFSNTMKLPIELPSFLDIPTKVTQQKNSRNKITTKFEESVGVPNKISDFKMQIKVAKYTFDVEFLSICENSLIVKVE